MSYLQAGYGFSLSEAPAILPPTREFHDIGTWKNFDRYTQPTFRNCGLATSSRKQMKGAASRFLRMPNLWQLGGLVPASRQKFSLILTAQAPQVALVTESHWRQPPLVAPNPSHVISVATVKIAARRGRARTDTCGASYFIPQRNLGRITESAFSRLETTQKEVEVVAHSRVSQRRGWQSFRLPTTASCE